MLQRTSWLCQVLGQLTKWARSKSSPQARPVRPGGWGEEGYQTRYHPSFASFHCWGTGRPFVAGNLNLICLFCLNAGPQPHSVHSLSQLSLTVLCTPKMAEKNSASTNLHINIGGGKKKRNKITGKYAHDWILPLVSHPHLWNGIKGQFSPGVHKHWLRYRSWVNPGWIGYNMSMWLGEM